MAGQPHVDGVRKVLDQITVLPVSRFDDDLRQRIGRAIYGNVNFWNYAIMPSPPIHIIVEHSHVTLTGIVLSEVDRQLARALATKCGALSVTSHLKTHVEAQEAFEPPERARRSTRQDFFGHRAGLPYG